MLTAILPQPKSVADVEPGSVVFVPETREWAIGLGQKYLFFLDTMREGTSGRMVADFEQRYEIQVDANTASNTSYPWSKDDNPVGGELMCILENGEATPAIVLKRNRTSRHLSAIDIRTANKRYLGSKDQAIVYQVWPIGLRCSDAPGDLAPIFSSKQQANIPGMRE